MKYVLVFFLYGFSVYYTFFSFVILLQIFQSIQWIDCSFEFVELCPLDTIQRWSQIYKSFKLLLYVYICITCTNNVLPNHEMTLGDQPRACSNWGEDALNACTFCILNFNLNFDSGQQLLQQLGRWSLEDLFYPINWFNPFKPKPH
jgi:hypothetical protein